MSTAAAVLASVSAALLIDRSAALVAAPIHGSRCASPFTIERGRTPLIPREEAFSQSTLVRSILSRNTDRNPLVRYYADEWVDADAELAFHVAPRTSNAAATTTLLRRLILRFSKAWHHLRESVRVRLERCTVYVLACENGKYYVGSTTNRKRRYRDHGRRKGSKWTRAHKPLGVLREFRRVPSQFLLGMESKVTAECMLEFGVNNVRGSMFCSPREYHMGDIKALTKFLGHYNDLNYKKVNHRLSETLPVPPYQMRNRQRKRAGYNRHMEGRCYSCGKAGHFAASCPEKKAVVSSLRP